ncbi:MAG: hypothetical protein MSR67_03180 [Oscillospiraceae bacterium]|nr:hypothetical protein [Oscillospiraceae bacterium]
MNRFENKLCPICRARFTDKADVVVCPICGTPHHRVCYEIRGKCGLENLHESGFVWNGRLPDEPEPVQSQPQNPFENNTQSAQNTTNSQDIQDLDPMMEMFGDADAGFNSFLKKLSDPALGEDGVSMKELTAYAATSSFHYGRAFDIFRTNIGGKKRKVFFNLASGFLAPAFQFYRKMDIFGAISGILLLIPVLIAALFPDFVLNNGFSYLLNLYNLAGLVILSAFGDYFYYKHAVKSIIKFRGSFQGDTMSDEYYQALAEKGKPSVLRAIIGCLAMVLCVSTILWLSGYFNKPIGII